MLRWPFAFRAGRHRDVAAAAKAHRGHADPRARLHGVRTMLARAAALPWLTWLPWLPCCVRGRNSHRPLPTRLCPAARGATSPPHTARVLWVQWWHDRVFFRRLHAAWCGRVPLLIRYLICTTGATSTGRRRSALGLCSTHSPPTTPCRYAVQVRVRVWGRAALPPPTTPPPSPPASHMLPAGHGRWARLRVHEATGPAFVSCPTPAAFAVCRS